MAGVRAYKHLYTRHMPTATAKKLCGKARNVMIMLEQTRKPTFAEAWDDLFPRRQPDVLFTTACNYLNERLGGQQQQRNEKRQRLRTSARDEAQERRVINRVEQAAVVGPVPDQSQHALAGVAVPPLQVVAAKRDRTQYYINYNATKKIKKDETAAGAAAAAAAAAE